MADLKVDLPSLAKVPPMFTDLAGSAEKCRAYGAAPFSAMDSALSNGRAGIINQLTSTHNRIRHEVDAFFGGVKRFAEDEGENIREAVTLYETLDHDLAATLDQTLFDQPTQDEVKEMGGRSSDLDLDAPVLGGAYLPGDPAAYLRPLTDYRSYEPNWRHPLDTNDELSAASLARDLIWYGSSFAARFGVCRPIDIIEEVVVPFTGDWAGIKACGDALHALDLAVDPLLGNSVWISDWINVVWQGNAADACWLHVRKLEQSLRGVSTPQRILKLYGDAYHDVADEVKRLERIASDAALELLDWAITLPLKAHPVAAGVYTAWTMINPPDSIFQIGRLVYELFDTVKLAVQAVWDFNARCELGALAPVNAPLPAVPEASAGY